MRSKRHRYPEFTHRVTVHTSSVMHAAARGLQVLEEDDLLEGCDLTGDVTVEVVTRTIHTISIPKLREWLRSGGNPKELAVKRELLRRKADQRG